MASELKEQFRAVLTPVRAGNALPTSLIEVLITYLVDECEFTLVTELVIADLVGTSNDAWKNEKSADLPSAIAQIVKRWVAFAPAPIPKPPSTGTPDVGAGVGGAVDRADATRDGAEEEIRELFGSSGATTRDLAKLAEDKAAQGISGVRLVIMSAALELARVPTAGEVIGYIFYGSNPVISDLVKKQRKAGLSTLSSILATSTHVRLDLNNHFTHLISLYSDMAHGPD